MRMKLKFEKNILISDEWLYILELTVGFESSLWTNAETKAQKYKDLVLQKSNIYTNVKFINLSMSALGIFDRCTSDFLDMLTDLQFDDATKNYILRKITTIATKTSYYIFCRRKKERPNPELWTPIFLTYNRIFFSPLITLI